VAYDNENENMHRTVCAMRILHARLLLCFSLVLIAPVTAFTMSLAELN